jgi:hypothetical protein
MPKPVPSRIVLELRKQLLTANRVWNGRGRKPIDDQRPTLVQELVRITGLSREVIHRILSGRSRSAKVSTGNRNSLTKINVSASVSNRQNTLYPPIAPPPGASDDFNASMARAMAHAYASPPPPALKTSTVAAPTPSRPAPPNNSPQAKRDPGVKGLEDIGLASSIAAKPIVSVEAIEARRALQDGIDWFLSTGRPPPALRGMLEETARYLRSLP